MDILCDDRAGASLPADMEAILTGLFVQALRYAYSAKGHLSGEAAEINDNVEISVSYVTAAEIRQLNKSYRQRDAETDVLSFPFYETLPPRETDGPPAALGDIVICVAAAQSQAEVYGHSFRRELAFLALHGMLHLLGYDHENPEDEAQMRKAQSEILQAAGIDR